MVIGFVDGVNGSELTGMLPGAASVAAGHASIFVVDDTAELIELYTVLLAEAGYTVRSFKHRASALEALRAEAQKPNLLITDHVGPFMPVEEFVQACRLVHPALRILMASGLHKPNVRFVAGRPAHFLPKPFTAEEFLAEVRRALTDL